MGSIRLQGTSCGVLNTIVFKQNCILTFSRVLLKDSHWLFPKRPEDSSSMVSATTILKCSFVQLLCPVVGVHATGHLSPVCLSSDRISSC